jgi:hypothetical protein
MARIFIDAIFDEPEAQENKKKEAEMIANLLQTEVVLFTIEGQFVYEGGQQDVVAQTS